MEDVVKILPKEVADLIRTGIYSLYRSRIGGGYLISARGEVYFRADNTGAFVSRLSCRPDFSEWEQMIPKADFDLSKVSARRA